MKYIRTEDNIYKVSQGIFGDYPIDRKGNVLGMPLPTVIKSADTIEELCDEFVEAHKVLKNQVFEKSYFDVVSEQVRNGAPIGNLYGAIWTDKGLIYVAKMNKKGELKLL